MEEEEDIITCCWSIRKRCRRFCSKRWTQRIGSQMDAATTGRSGNRGTCRDVRLFGNLTKSPWFSSRHKWTIWKPKKERLTTSVPPTKSRESRFLWETTEESTLVPVGGDARRRKTMLLRLLPSLSYVCAIVYPLLGRSINCYIDSIHPRHILEIVRTELRKYDTYLFYNKSIATGV